MTFVWPLDQGELLQSIIVLAPALRIRNSQCPPFGVEGEMVVP